MVKNKRFRYEDLLDIWDKRQEGETQEDIALEYNVSPRSIGKRLYGIELAMGGKPSSDVYKRVAKALKFEREAGENELYVDNFTEDMFEKMKKAQVAYNQAITTFIEDRIEAEVGRVKKENEALKDELKKARVVVDEAKGTNWVSALQRKWS